MSLLIIIAYTVKKRRTRGNLDRWAEEEMMAKPTRPGHPTDPEDETVH